MALRGAMLRAPFNRKAPLASRSHLHTANKRPLSSSVLGGGGLGGLDEVPEFGILLERFILAGGKAGAEEEVLEGVPVQDAVDDHAKLMALEVDAVVANAETVHGASSALELAEVFQVRAHDLLGQAAEFAQNIELQVLGHARELSSTGRVEDDLERAHLVRLVELVARTGIEPVFRP